MSNPEALLPGELIRIRHNLNYEFRRVLAEPRYLHSVSDVTEFKDLRDDRRDFEEILTQHARLWKKAGYEYQPSTLREAYLSFAFGRNATPEQIASLAADIASVSEFDKPLVI